MMVYICVLTGVKAGGLLLLFSFHFTLFGAVV